MLGEITGAPGDASQLSALLVERAVPAIEHILCQVFRLIQVALLTGDVIGFQQFAYQPHLVVVNIEYAFHLSSSFIGTTVYAVYRPLLGLRIRGQRKSTCIILQIIIKLSQKFLVTIKVRIIKSRFSLCLSGLHGFHRSVYSLNGTGVHPHTAQLAGTIAGIRIVIT